MSGSLRMIRRWLRRRSREGIVGLVLLAVAISFDLALLVPAHNRIKQLQQTVFEGKALANSSAKPMQRKIPATQQLTRYYSYFPPQSSTSDWLKKIYQAADAQKLQLTEGEYRIQQSGAGKLISYHIAIPVEGSYTQLRHFITAVLVSVPIASLDHVSFERKKIEDPTIDAKVTFTLYLAASS